MRAPRRRILGVAASLAALAIGAGGWALWPSTASAQVDSGPKPGVLTIAVPVSADPASRALLGALRAHPWFAANAGRVRLAEVPAEPRPVGHAGGPAGVSVGAYRMGPRGQERVASRSGFAGANDVVRWASELDRAPEARTTDAPTPPAPTRDPYLVRTDGERPYPVPSQQGYSAPASVPQAPATQPAAMAPQAMQPAMMMMAPASTAPAMAPASVIQAPSQSFVIQQAQPQFYFAQQAPATAMVPQAMQPAAMGPSNIFMPASVAPAMAPASVPMTMAPAGVQPMMMVAPAATAPTMAVAALAPATANVNVAATGPLLTGAAVASQSVSVPASSSRSRVRVRGPGPLASAAARFGERLTTLGRTRIETIQETNLETQLSQGPPGQLVTLTSTSASPVVTPQNISVPASLPPQPQAPPPLAPSPQGPQPSPQAVTKGGHWHRND